MNLLSTTIHSLLSSVNCAKIGRSMSFKIGFNKIAVTLVTLSPEEYYETVGAKDKYVGALGGAISGAAAGGVKKRTAKAALIGSALGGASGASVGYLGGKGVRKYQSNKVRRLTGELHLKTSPGRGKKE